MELDNFSTFQNLTNLAIVTKINSSGSDDSYGRQGVSDIQQTLTETKTTWRREKKCVKPEFRR